MAFSLLMSGVVAMGCRAIGPGTVPLDRSDYSMAVARSWQHQTLLNIVKLRYLDMPVFMDIGQIVAGYSIESTISASGGYERDSIVGLLGGSVKYTDRPTVTYLPKTGDDYLKGLLTPMRPESVFFMIESGYPADAVLLSSLSSINGLKNHTIMLAGGTAPDPQFLRVLHLLRRLQLAGSLGLRIETDYKRVSIPILTIRDTEHESPEIVEAGREFRTILNLDEDATEFKLVYSAARTTPNELAIVTRSIVQVMQVMASEVELPIKDVTDGRAVPGHEIFPNTDENTRLIRIHSGIRKPKDAAITVRYRNHWFWVDDRDLKSKRSFNFIMAMFSLSNVDQDGVLPLITIPAQ